jgi:hypothetical protein
MSEAAATLFPWPSQPVLRQVERWRLGELAFAAGGRHPELQWVLGAGDPSIAARGDCSPRRGVLATLG